MTETLCGLSIDGHQQRPIEDVLVEMVEKIRTVGSTPSHIQISGPVDYHDGGPVQRSVHRRISMRARASR